MDITESIGEGSAAAGLDPGSSSFTDALPECAPAELEHFYFGVGPNTFGNVVPGEMWPNGAHSGHCVYDGRDVREAALGIWSITFRFSDCTVDGQPSPYSFDLQVGTSVPFETSLSPGHDVQVNFWLEQENAYTYQAWYSVRDTASSELLITAFADDGGATVPTRGAEAEDWLLPFEAVLGGHACPPDWSGCFPETRANLMLTRGDIRLPILSHTTMDLGDYGIQLGFAGSPDHCEGIPQSPAVHGLIFRR